MIMIKCTRVFYYNFKVFIIIFEGNDLLCPNYIEGSFLGVPSRYTIHTIGAKIGRVRPAAAGGGGSGGGGWWWGLVVEAGGPWGWRYAVMSDVVDPLSPPCPRTEPSPLPPHHRFPERPAPSQGPAPPRRRGWAAG